MKKFIIGVILGFIINFPKIEAHNWHYSEQDKNENMIKHKYKRLKTSEALEYIEKDKVVKKNHPFSPWSYMYECDDNILIVENTKEKKFTLYYDRKKFYEDIEYTQRLINNHPLSSKEEQAIILDIENNKSLLLDRLFSELDIKPSGQLNDIDLKEFDKKLKLYGYEKAYFNLMLNLIVFCGEYIRERKGGFWNIHSDNRGWVEPVYKDKDGRDYSFEINTVLFRQFEKNRFNISDLIDRAITPPIFQVVPNPGLRDPNKQ